MSDEEKSLAVSNPLQYFTAHEKKLLKAAEKNGSKPIAPTLAADMFQLFLEGYTCWDIAKQNKGLLESDVLVCRKRYNWDEEKDKFAILLKEKVAEKLIKTKLESVEFLTNTLSVTHKHHREKLLKFIQTGKEEDFPEEFIPKSPQAYRTIIETLQGITGESRVTEQKINQNVTVSGTSDGSPVMKDVLTPEKVAQMLAKIAMENSNGN